MKEFWEQSLASYDLMLQGKASTILELKTDCLESISSIAGVIEVLV
jgi:hypothetical protein